MSMLFTFACLLSVATSAKVPIPEASDATSDACLADEAASSTCMAVGSHSDLSGLLQSRAHVTTGLTDGVAEAGSDAKRVTDLQTESTATFATTPAPNLLMLADLAATVEDGNLEENDEDLEIEDQDTIERLEAAADAGVGPGLSDTTATVTTATVSMIGMEAGDVSCGGHRADTCAACPGGHGKGWCNGECFWKDNQCVGAGRHLLTDDNPYFCQSNGNCQARTCSIHFNFFRPSGAGSASWYYNEVKPITTSDATFYAVSTTAYGYAGIQTIHKDPNRAKDRAVICSIWDQKTGNAKMKTCGEDVECKGFGGEGTGAKAMWYFDWQLGKHYAFMLHRKNVGNNRVEHSCWFYAEELEQSHPGGWKHIATSTSGANWAGSTFKNTGSFVEQWTHKHSDTSRHAEFGPAYFKNEDGPWLQSSKSYFRSYYLSSRLKAGTVRCDFISAGQPAGTKRLFMQTGGTKKASAELRQAPRFLSYPAAPCGLPTPLYLFDGKKKAILQSANVQTSGSVSCGGHTAPVCASCPYTSDGHFHGMSWCNGACQWKYQQCMLPESSPCEPQGVSCGGHRAGSCSDCPFQNGHNYGRGWCNGECAWRLNSCRDK